MVMLILLHFEFLSVLSVLAWGRLGIFSSAEGFVLMSGFVVGMVYRRKIDRDGLRTATTLLWRRALILYRAIVVVIASIALLSLISWLNVFQLTHWTNLWTGESYLLYPPAGSSLLTFITQTLLLKVGPHQYQVIGLYVVLLAIAPGILYLLERKQTTLIVIFSWALYFFNDYARWQITGARYEYAFPTLTWQLLFLNGMVIGYHKDRVLRYITSEKSRWLYLCSLSLLVFFLILANHKSDDLFWHWGRLNLISIDTYHEIYERYFDKTWLGLGRLLNNAALYIVAYVLLTRYWHWFNQALGWLLIPLGQNSLYVFTLHVYFTILVYNTGLVDLKNIWINSALHLFVIVSIWIMVKKQLLFSFIPR